jgi:hypothetical protein
LRLLESRGAHSAGWLIDQKAVDWDRASLPGGYGAIRRRWSWI